VGVERIRSKLQRYGECATKTGDDRFYRVLSGIARPAYRTMIPTRLVDAHRMPPTGGVIVAANHISFFDSIVLMHALPRRLYFIGKAEYLDSWTTRRLFPAMGLIPIEREQARSAMASLEVAAEVLRRGDVLGIYPEGTRSRDGLLHRGHSGVAQLALITGAPILPVGLVGTDRIQPVGARVPRPFRRADVLFGEPIDPTAYGGSPRRRRQLITDDLMEAIRRLCGRETAEGFASDEPPLIRGGTESVYQVHRVGAVGATWRQAAQFAVADVCTRFDDGRVGQVRRMACHLLDDGAVRFSAELAVSVKFQSGEPTSQTRGPRG
jgi:1-acyl-sn-glycerol-3-phosphate acyltransferase